MWSSPVVVVDNNVDSPSLLGSSTSSSSVVPTAFWSGWHCVSCVIVIFRCFAWLCLLNVICWWVVICAGFCGVVVMCESFRFNSSLSLGDCRVTDPADSRVRKLQVSWRVSLIVSASILILFCSLIFCPISWKMSVILVVSVVRRRVSSISSFRSFCKSFSKQSAVDSVQVLSIAASSCAACWSIWSDTSPVLASVRQCVRFGHPILFSKFLILAPFLSSFLQAVFNSWSIFEKTILWYENRFYLMFQSW